MLDARVEHILHVGKAGMSEDRAIPQRARSPFHPALKPADYISDLDLLGDRFKQRFAFHFSILQPGLPQSSFNLSVRKFWAKIRMFHDIFTRLFQDRMISVER